MAVYEHFVAGQKTSLSGGGDTSPVFYPHTGEEAHRVLLATSEDVSVVVDAAREAFDHWSQMPPVMREKILRQWHTLLVAHQDEIAECISMEHGKSLIEAKGSLMRGLDVLDYACHVSHHLKGHFSDNIAKGIDCYDMRQPLGVCVGISPFNFPAMIALWMSSVALATGNTFVLKPSERNPGTALLLAHYATMAGIPAGVFNVVQGAHTAVNALLTHPDVQAISFVGQTQTARYVYETGTRAGKRVQAFGGAKNHLIVMPDADAKQVSEALVGAAFGSAGERCMAVPVAVFVGDTLIDQVIAQVSEFMSRLKVGPYTDPTSEMGPLITQAHRQRVLDYIALGIGQGARLVVDGRQHPGIHQQKGFYVGPTLFDAVTPDMTIYKEEIFGPVLCLMRVKTYEEALALPTQHAYGNGVALFTRDGDTARDFARRVQVGMVGINVPIPIPTAIHSFGGWKASSFGDTGMHGLEGVRFFTKLKTVTTRWPSGIRSGINFALPTAEDQK